MGEETYDQLRSEWLEKIQYAQASLDAVERDNTYHLNDLELALTLLEKLSHLYQRLEFSDKAVLLRILAKHIIVNQQGDIIDHQLNSPFLYLESLVRGLQNNICG